jgi:hypothetical protein
MPVRVKKTRQAKAFSFQSLFFQWNTAPSRGPFCGAMIGGAAALLRVRISFSQARKA